MDMMQPPPPQQQIDPAMLLTATLQAVEWNFVMEALSEAKYRAAAPIIGKLDTQLRRDALDKLREEEGK